MNEFNSIKTRNFIELPEINSTGKILNQIKRKSQQEKRSSISSSSSNDENFVKQIKRKSQKFLKSITPQYDSSSLSRTSSDQCDDDNDDENQLEKKLSKVEMKEFKKLTLDEILNDSIYFDFIKSYAALEYSSESLIFYEEVQNLKEISLTNFEERKNFVDEIINLFILPNSDSVLELNISQKDRQNFYSKFDDQKEKKKIEDEIFHDLINIIVKYSIEDTYTRFIFSDLYKQMMTINLSL